MIFEIWQTFGSFCVVNEPKVSSLFFFLIINFVSICGDLENIFAKYPDMFKSLFGWAYSL